MREGLNARFESKQSGRQNPSSGTEHQPIILTKQSIQRPVYAAFCRINRLVPSQKVGLARLRQPVVVSSKTRRRPDQNNLAWKIGNSDTRQIAQIPIAAP